MHNAPKPFATSTASTSLRGILCLSLRMFVGSACDLRAKRVTPAKHPSYTPRQLEALASLPEPDGYLPLVARRSQAFSKFALRHGMPRDNSLFAASEKQRRLEAQQTKMSQRIAKLTAQFDAESRLLGTLEAELESRQLARERAMVKFAATSLIQRQWRIFEAKRKLRLLRRAFAARLITDAIAFRYRLKRQRVAIARVKRALASVLRRLAARHARRQLRATLALQRTWRGAACRARQRYRRTLDATSASSVATFLLYGFARAQRCLMCPHYAARTIQLRYRRRLRRRRVSERRVRRSPALRSKPSGQAMLKRIVEDANNMEKHSTFVMPSEDMITRYFACRNGTSPRLNSEDVTHLIHTANLLKRGISPQEAFGSNDHGSPGSCFSHENLSECTDNDGASATESDAHSVGHLSAFSSVHGRCDDVDTEEGPRRPRRPGRDHRAKRHRPPPVTSRRVVSSRTPTRLYTTEKLI